MDKLKTLVRRIDGQMVNVFKLRGQLFVCSTGCCCGHVERGFAPVLADIYHDEWERRKLRNKVHLSQSGCVGPCELANVVTLIFDRHIYNFHSINTADHIRVIFDYLEAMLAIEDSSLVPIPPQLHHHTFNYFM